MEATRRGFLEALAGALAAISLPELAATPPAEKLAVFEPHPAFEPFDEPFQFWQEEKFQAVGEYELLKGSVSKAFGLFHISTLIDPAARLTTIETFLKSCDISLHLGPNDTCYYQCPALAFGSWSSRMKVWPTIMIPPGLKVHLRAHLYTALPETLKVTTAFDGMRYGASSDRFFAHQRLTGGNA
jgi:hypothetical protein